LELANFHAAVVDECVDFGAELVAVVADFEAIDEADVRDRVVRVARWWWCRSS